VIRIVSAGLFAAMTVVAARALQPAGFGVYSFIIALVSFATIPTTAGLSQTLARETAYARARGNDAALAPTWLWALKWALLTTALIVAVFTVVASRIGGLSALAEHLFLAVALLVLMPFPRILSGALQGLGHVWVSQFPEHIVRPGLVLICASLLWLLSPGDTISVSSFLTIYVGALIVEGLVAAAALRRFAPFRLRDGMSGRLSRSHRALAFSALSFGALASAHMINGNLDVIMLGLLASEAETGIYKAASIVADLVSLGLTVVSAVLMPQIAGLHALGEAEALQRLVSKAARQITLFASLGAALQIGTGMFVLSIGFGDSYAGGYPALVILTLGQLLGALFGPVALVLNMTGHERLTLFMTGVSVLSNGVLNSVLIPLYGIEGAALATATSLLLWNLLLVIALKRRTGLVSTVFGRSR